MGFTWVPVLEHGKEYQALPRETFRILADRYDVKIDMEAGNGFCDLRMFGPDKNDPRICVGFKKVKSESQTKATASEAPKQIKDQKYAFGLKSNRIHYGIAFNVKTPETVSERIIPT